MNLTRRLAEIIREEAELASGPYRGDIEDGTLLARTGLDSLGFISMMVKVEQEFGLNPFDGVDEITYPETFGDLVRLYSDEAAAQ